MRFSSLLFLILLSSNLIAQDSSIVPAIIKRLYQEPRPVQVFSFSINKLVQVDDLPNSFTTAGQEITKTKKGVFLNQLGSGRTYELKEFDGELKWERIDSTIYYGYNLVHCSFQWTPYFTRILDRDSSNTMEICAISTKKVRNGRRKSYHPQFSG
jgi:hypothetical protein